MKHRHVGMRQLLSSKSALVALLSGLVAGLPVQVSAQSIAPGGAPSSVSASTGAAATAGAAPGAAASALPSLNRPGGAAGRGATDDAAARANPTAAVVRDFAPIGTTAYQKFVRETTGRDLGLFGYNLFTGGAFPSVQNVPVPADYVLGPGDEIALKVWGAVDADLRLVVDRNGQVSIPRVGTVNVAGTKASMIESVLRGQISKVFNNFQLSATLGQLRSIQIFVVGQARSPGAYTVSSLSTLVSALFESGGPSALGSMRNIQLKRDGRTLTTIDLYKFITEGDKSSDAKLLPGDVIVVPPAGPRVALTGSTDTPAVFELASSEEPLGKLLSYAGRTQALTSTQKVLVERIDANQGKAPRTVEERALDAKGMQSMVRDGDVVTLFQISPQFSNAVTLRGNVAAPLRYSFRPGMRVSDLIPERDALIQADYYVKRNLLVQFESGRQISAGRVLGEVKNLLDEINWDYAVVERLDPKEVRSQLIPFNLSKAVRDKDPANNIALLPGDVVTIFGVNDLPVPIEKKNQFVRLGGEVKVPGIYQVRPGETLEQLIGRVGGVTQNAYPYGTVFIRETTRVQQQANLDRAVRRVEADLNSQAATSLQNTRDTDKGETVQAQLASQRLLLTRVQSLRATGRIALELDPRNPVFPAISLEDNDQITVPSIPSFVGVFGAVAAETSFLHRPNLSVRDYLKRAGLTRDADASYVMIVRADGAIEGADGADSGWVIFNSTFMDKRLNPGDAIFVPEKLDRKSAYNKFVDGAKDWTAIFYQFGLGAAGLKTLKN